MKKLLPILLALIGTGAGVGAGVFLRPAPDPVEQAEMAKDGEAVEGDEKKDMAEKDSEPTKAKADGKGEESAESDYVKMNNQFVIPIVEESEVAALVVMSLSVEVNLGQKDSVFRKEPKLRDSFLQVMFDHANVGGFSGAFTNASNLEVLRAALVEVAVRDAGENVKDVLILEIARQDL